MHCDSGRQSVAQQHCCYTYTSSNRARTSPRQRGHWTPRRVTEEQGLHPAANSHAALERVGGASMHGQPVSSGHSHCQAWRVTRNPGLSLAKRSDMPPKRSDNGLEKVKSAALLPRMTDLTGAADLQAGEQSRQVETRDKPNHSSVYPPARRCQSRGRSCMM